MRIHKKNRHLAIKLYMVPEAGLEPAQYRYRRILSPLRLPVSPLGRLLDYYNLFQNELQWLF